MARTGKAKWQIAGGVVVVASVFVLLVIRSMNAGHYRFLSELGGRQRGPLEFSGFGMNDPNIENYSFSGPVADVRAAMNRDLTADGWKLVYSDSEFEAFRKWVGRKLATTTFSVSESLSRGEPDVSTTCVVSLPRSRSWLSDRVEALKVKLGWTPKLEPIRDFFFGDDFKLDWKGKSDGVDIIWRNRTPNPVTAKVSSVFLGGYESAEPPPFSMSLKPWQVATTRLHFSGFKGTPDPVMDFSYLVGYTLLGGRGSRRTGWTEPNVVAVADRPGHRALVFASISGDRKMEVRGLRVWVNGVAERSVPASALVAPPKKLRVPLRPRGGTVQIMVRGEWRLLPNKRWTPFAIAL